VTAGLVGRDDTTTAFFDGAAGGQFLIRRCPAGHASRPQARQCSTCARVDLRWEPASGRARLVSWAVVPARGASAGEAPTVPALVELDEGPWWWTAVVGADPESLTEGLRLRVIFEQPEGGEAVPVFEPE
jgi:uncharacterized OB-fold protein